MKSFQLVLLTFILQLTSVAARTSVTVKQLTALCDTNDGVMYLTSCYRIYQQSAGIITWEQGILGCELPGFPPAHAAWWGHSPMLSKIFMPLGVIFQANIGIGTTFTGVLLSDQHNCSGVVRLDTTGTVGQGFYFVGRAGDGTDVKIGPMGEQTLGTYTRTPIWRDSNPDTPGDARMVLRYGKYRSLDNFSDNFYKDDVLASTWTLLPNGTHNMVCQYDPTLLVNAAFEKVADLMLSLTVGGGGVMQKTATSSIQCGQECIRLNGLCLVYSFGPTGGCRVGVSIHFDYHWHSDFCDPSTSTGDVLYQLIDIS